MVKFDGSGHFKLWHRVKIPLVQQNLVKVLYEKQPKSMNITNWQELEVWVVTTFRLCLDDDVMYHIMDEESPTVVWEKTRKSVLVQVIDEQTLS